MLQKNKSQRVKLLKYGLSAPLFVLMLILSSAIAGNSKTLKAINAKITNVMLLPPPPPPTNPFKQKTTDTASALKTQTIETPLPIGIADTSQRDPQVFASVEKEPSFPGGADAFFAFLTKNVRYPATMRDLGVQGKVIVTFVVEKDGSLSGARVLRRPNDENKEEFNWEALRVISLSPKWTPGYQNGKPVRVQYTVPVMFSLADAATNVAPADTNKKGGVTVVGYSSNKTTQTYYTVDGKEVSNADAQNVIKGHNVLMTTVYKNSPDKDKNTIEITTFDKPGQIYMVDGKEVNASDAKIIVNANSFHTLGYEAGPSTSGKSVVEITTKKPLDFVMDPPGKKDPLYLINGKEMKEGDFRAIDPNDIESITVLQGQSATALYGSKAVNGAVLVTTKSAAKKTQPAGGK